MCIPNKIKDISISDYSYELPDNRIAKYPLAQRDQSKLLVWRNGEITDRKFYQVSQELPIHSLLVFNNTRVIRARLFFKKETGAKIEVFVLDPVEPADYAQNFQQTQNCTWQCIVGNLKKWKTGKLILPINTENDTINLYAENVGESAKGRNIQFTWDNPNYTFSEVIEKAGNIPIPPYLNRDSEANDLLTYQTVYSKIKGSVAAPTAGLHFTDDILENLRNSGIKTKELTLHVGAGTFQPVKSENIGGHEMHTEHIIIDRNFISDLLEHQGKIIAVGTTSIRTLESLYWMGVKILKNKTITSGNLLTGQWEPYGNEVNVSKQEALNALLNYMDNQGSTQISTATQIIIAPGYRFRIIDGMFTNFHQPQSTLLLLISAFLGTDWKRAYKHALSNDYRFLSYGDSNLYLVE